MQNKAKQNYPGIVALLQHSTRKPVGLILQRSRAHTGRLVTECVNTAVILTWLSKPTYAVTALTGSRIRRRRRRWSSVEQSSAASVAGTSFTSL